MIITNSPRGDAPAVAPTRPDGALYRFEMLFDASTRRVYADSLTELLAALIHDYLQLADDPQAAARARLQYAVRTQVRLQATIAAACDLSTLTDQERELLLGSRHQPPQLSAWSAPIPLVLVETYYQPYGPLPRPTPTPRDPSHLQPNLIWINPIDEAELLTSLHAAGQITLAERNH